MTASPVLVIAGSDPGGGAGVQASLRAMAALGVPAISALTALTVQNSQELQRMVPVPPDLLGEQLQSLFADSSPAAVQISLLPGAAQIRRVADLLRRYRPPSVILDPVLASGGGVPFLPAEERGCLLAELLPLCRLVTPNLPETALLLGRPVRSLEERIRAAKEFVRLGARAALIKGGHGEGDPEDLLLDEDGYLHRFGGERIVTTHDHGTGCFLSSVIAGRIALGDSLPLAVARARAMIQTGLSNPIVVGQGRGYPDPFARVPTVVETRTHSMRIALFPGLYVLTDPGLQGNRSAEAVASAAYDGGAAIVQLREKRAPTPDLIAMARRLAAMALQRERLFIVNDRIDVALAAGADGVHVGPEDMPTPDARRLLGPDRILGVSVGTIEEARQAAPYASYLAVGAIYGSATKSDAGPAVGPERIAAIGAALPGIPLAAIGGIHAGNLQRVLDAGAASVAVISAVLKAPDLTAAVRDLTHRISGSAAR